MRGRSLVIEERGVCHRDDTGVGIDGETATGVVVEGVGDGVGAVGIGGQGGNAHGRAVGRVLGHGVRRGIAVGDGTDVELVDVAQVDREGLCAGRAIGAGGLDRHGVAGRVLIVEQRAIGDGDDAGVGIDGKPAARGVVEAVADRVGAVGIGSEGGHADSRAIGGVLGHGVRRGIAVRDRTDVELVDIREIDRERLGRGRAVRRGGLDGHRMAGRIFVVEQRAIGDGDDAGVGIDGKPATGRIVQAVADGVRCVGIGRQGGHAHGGSVGGILRDRVGAAIVVRDRADVGLVGIAQIDREGLRAGRAIGAGRLDRNRMRSRGLVVEQRAIRDGDHTGVGIDRETAAGGVVEAVADCVGAVGIGCQGGHTDSRAIGGILGHRIGGAVVVGDGADIELIDIREVDREGLGAGRAVSARRLDSHRMRSRVLVVEQRTVGDGDHAGVGIDGKASAGGVVEGVADGVARVGIGRQGRDANRGTVGRVLGDRVGAAIVVGDGTDAGFVDVAQVDREGLGRGRAVGARRLYGDGMRGGGLVVEQRAIGDGDDAGVGVDGKPSAGGIVEAVGDGVGAVSIGGEGRDAYSGTVGGRLGDRVGGAVAVGDGADIKLIGVAQVDGEGLGAGRAVGGGGLYRDRVRGGGLVVEQRAVCDSDDAGVGVDGEPATGGVVEAVADGIGAVGVGRQGGHADSCAVGGVFGDRIGGGVAVGDRADIGLIGVAQIDRESLGAGRSVARRGLDGDGVRGGGLVVEQRGIGDSDDAGVGVDGKPATSSVVEGVGHRVGTVGIGGEGGDTHGRAIGGILGDRVGSAVAIRDRADVEFVGVREIDRKGLSRGRAIAGRGLDGHRVRGRGLVVQQRGVGDGDDAGVGVDREATARRVVEAVGNRIRAIGVRSEGGDAHGGAVGGVLGDRVRGSVAVGDRADIGLVDIR